MKRTQFFLNLATAVAGLSLLAACSSDEPAVSGNETTSRKITLVSNVSMSRSANVDLQRTQIAAGVKVGAFVTTAGAMIADNAELTADGNGGLAGEVGNYPESGSVSVYAYAPFNATWTLDGANNFSIAADQSSDQGYLASDLLRGVPDGENSFSEQDAAIALRFEHMLSKVNVKVNKGSSDVDLIGATISLTRIKTNTTLNVTEGIVGEAQGMPSDIKAVKIEADNADFAGSAIIVPQKVEAGEFVKIAAADGRIIVASLASDVNFVGKKAYTYTVKLSGGGSSVTATISVNTSISDWVDDEELSGDGNEKVSYEVGDYVMKDGSLMKAAEVKSLSAEQQNNVAAVIFSTSVNSEDAAKGYAGYAVSVGGRISNVAWRELAEGDESAAPLLRAEGVTDAATAFNAHDGLAITNLAQNAADTGIYSAFDFTNYSFTMNISGASTLSGWFLPSIGQLVSIFNNLGDAGISASDVTMNNYGEYDWTNVDIVQIVSNINSHKVGDTEIMVGHGWVQYISSTEFDASRAWGFSVTQDAGKENFKIISKAGKTGKRSLLPCVAYKLPAE